MRVLADENVPLSMVVALREAGHDVLWVREGGPGTSDVEVLSWASGEDRILLTFDKDFGDLAFRSRLPGGSGIILIRLRAASPEALVQETLSALAERSDWEGYFSVLEEGRVRTLRLPAPN